MAGSLEMMIRDVKENEGDLTSPFTLLDNMGDAYEACEEAVAEIERLQNELKTCCDHDNIWKHAQEMGFEKANNELKAENKRLRLLQEDTALQCLHQEDEIKRLRVALERIEQLDERMAPITNMVRAKEIAREALEGER